MKRILGAVLALLTSAAFAATTVPVQLLNPAGSTAGQAILSTGPSTAPAWGAVTLSGVTGTLAIANGGTGATSASAARTNLGLGTAATANTGTSGSVVPLLNAANTWSLSQTFSVRPTFNGATPWDSANLASPATTVGVTNGSNAAAGAIGEQMTAAGSAISLTSGTPANCTSITLTAGDWDVWGYVQYAPGTGTSFALMTVSLNTTSTTHAVSPDISQLAFAGTANFGQSLQAPMRIFNVTTGTQVFLVATGGFSGGTATMACRMYARRRH
jgi:hypothetical protein